ncbi:hypothetical protein DFJ77DRAFT_437712 [Powellomyces hirtus]|nr:hypothetical protein DFJ77DRAFT_437712 [Powellomyces hirtus]
MRPQATSLPPVVFLLATSLSLAAHAQDSPFDCSTVANLCLPNPTISPGIPFDLVAYVANFDGFNNPNARRHYSVAMYRGDLQQDKTPFTTPCDPPAQLVQQWPADQLTWIQVPNATQGVCSVQLTLSNDNLRAGGDRAERGGSFFFMCTLGPNIGGVNGQTSVNVGEYPDPSEARKRPERSEPERSEEWDLREAGQRETGAQAPGICAERMSPSEARSGEGPPSGGRASERNGEWGRASERIIPPPVVPTTPIQPASATPSPSFPSINPAVATPATSTPISPPPPPPPEAAVGPIHPAGSDSSLSIGAIIGIVAAAVVALLACFLCLCLRARRRKQGGLEGGAAARSTAPWGAASGKSKRKQAATTRSISDNPSLARLVGTEGQRLRAASPENGTEEIRVGSFGSRTSLDRRDAAVMGMEPMAVAGSSTDAQRNLLSAAPAAAAVAITSRSSYGSDAPLNSDETNKVNGSANNPFADPVRVVAAAPPMSQHKNRGSILASMHQQYRSLSRPSATAATTDALPTTDSAANTTAPRAASPPPPPPLSTNPYQPYVEPNSTEADRHTMAQLIAEAYRKGLADEQDHWHGQAGGDQVVKPVEGMRHVGDGRTESATTLPGVDVDPETAE